MRNVKLITDAATEPVTLAEAKAFLKVDYADDDALITGYIKAARKIAETYTGRAFINQTHKLVYDKFPGNGNSIFYSIEDKLSHYRSDDSEIYLPILPVSSITDIKYYDTENVLNTVSTSYYRLDDISYRVCLNNDCSWSDFTLRDSSAVEITFVAGYGASATDVPQLIKTAILQMVGALYERGMCDCPEYLLNPYKLVDSLWLS